MKPVQQEKTESGSGDCFAACIASLLEMPLEEVPNFCAEGEEWPINAINWYRGQGFAILEFDYSDQPDSVAIAEMKSLGGYCIVSGQSSRFDCLHAVIYKDGELIHDPSPDGGGVKDIQYVTFLCAHDPSASRRENI